MIETEILKSLGTKLGTYYDELDSHFQKKVGTVEAMSMVNVIVPFQDDNFWDTEIRDSKASQHEVTLVLEDFQQVLKTLFDEIAYSPSLVLQGFLEL